MLPSRKEKESRRSFVKVRRNLRFFLSSLVAHPLFAYLPSASDVIACLPSASDVISSDWYERQARSVFFQYPQGKGHLGASYSTPMPIMKTGSNRSRPDECCSDVQCLGLTDDCYLDDSRRLSQESLQVRQNNYLRALVIKV